MNYKLYLGFINVSQFSSWLPVVTEIQIVPQHRKRYSVFCFRPISLYILHLREKKKICSKQKIGSPFIYLITTAISFIAYLQEYLLACCQQYHNLFIQRLCVNESFLIWIKQFASIAGKRKVLALFWQMKQPMNQVHSIEDN